MSEKEQCKAEVRDRSSRWPRKYQCQRKAVKDGYCKQHHPDSVAERRKESDERYERQFQNSPLQLLGKERERNARLLIALADAIRRPLGVIPKSAEEFITLEMLDEAEKRRTGK